MQLGVCLGSILHSYILPLVTGHFKNNGAGVEETGKFFFFNNARPSQWVGENIRVLIRRLDVLRFNGSYLI